MIRIVEPSRYWSAHTHSRYSVNDALPTVEAIVARAKELHQPAVGLTDHGNMAGTAITTAPDARRGSLGFALSRPEPPAC